MYKNIDDILKDDSLWHKMAYKHTKCHMQADELVHKFYMNYMNLKQQPVINKSYIYNALTNIWIREIEYQLKNSLSLYTEVNNDTDDEYDYAADIKKQKLIDSIKEELESIDWFHRTIFKYVVIDGISMRQLERDTNISFTVINKSVNKTKLYLKNKFKDENE